MTAMADRGTAESRAGKLRRALSRLLTASRNYYVTRMSELSDKVQTQAIPPIGGCPPSLGSLPRVYSFGRPAKHSSNSYWEEQRGLVVAADKVPGRQDLADNKIKYSAGRFARKRQVVDIGIGLGRIEEEEKSLLGGDYQW
ncbi:unnamed protein product [Linum trigynum]|uniref:Uncharacterized protein n=1 Tax=Linum trigynum TaxID=586398 RepID=A0AAV2FZE6_9ROSI